MNEKFHRTRKKTSCISRRDSMRKFGAFAILLLPSLIFAGISVLKNGAGFGVIGGELVYRFQDHYAFFSGIGTNFESFSILGGFRYYFANEFEPSPFISLGGGILPIAAKSLAEEEISFPVPLFLAAGGYEYYITPSWKLSVEAGFIGGIVLVIPIVSPTLGVSIGYTF